MAVFMLGISLFLWLMSHDYEYSINLLKSMAPAGIETIPFFTTVFNEDIITSLLSHTTLFALTASVSFAILSFVNNKKSFLIMAVLLSSLHCADIYGFKLSEIKLKATPLNEELTKIIDFHNMPFAKRRDVSFENNNPRAELLKVLPIKAPGVLYSSTNAFTFKDEVGNQFRNDFWLLPFDNYLRAYWKQSIHDLSNKPLALFFGFRLEFPQGHPAAFKISGVTEDKIQFFSGADFIPSDDTIASLMTDNNYKGDMIFLSAPEKYQETNPVVSDNYLASNKRLHLPYQVLKFNANNLEVTTNNNSPQPVWLFYSDVWHPLWRATVNGKDTPVYKANLAYKAVQLEPGLNKVHFYFKSRLISFIYIIFGLNALCWLGMILYLNGKIIFNQRQLKD
jgi:hypothetical protein